MAQDLGVDEIIVRALNVDTVLTTNPTLPPAAVTVIDLGTNDYGGYRPQGSFMPTPLDTLEARYKQMVNEVHSPAALARYLAQGGRGGGESPVLPQVKADARLPALPWQRTVHVENHGKELVRYVADLERELRTSYRPRIGVRLIAATLDPTKLKPEST